MSTLPKILIITEVGTWSQPTWSTDPDDKIFLPEKWQAWDYNGTDWYTARQKEEVRAWLIGKGYTDTGDGTHYERAADAPLDASIEPWPPRAGVYSIFSTYAKEALIITALGLQEVAEWVAQHPEIAQEAAKRREELANEQ
jgi:hypothetical protein